jgi:hypothetical protein
MPVYLPAQQPHDKPQMTLLEIMQEEGDRPKPKPSSFKKPPLFKPDTPAHLSSLPKTPSPFNLQVKTSQRDRKAIKTLVTSPTPIRKWISPTSPSIVPFLDIQLEQEFTKISLGPATPVSSSISSQIS